MLKTRIITAVCLLPLVLGAIFYLDTPYFALVMMIPVVLGGWEWANIMGIKRSGLRWLYALGLGGGLWLQTQWQWNGVFYLSLAWWAMAIFLVRSYPDKVKWWSSPLIQGLIGWLLLLPAWWGMVVIHQQSYGPYWLLYAFLLVWGADTGAYFAGRKWGRRKLAPAVSPGKTIEGLLGGMIVTGTLALVVAFQLDEILTGKVIPFLMISLAAVVGSVYGDLVESMFKRQRGIKDSSHILPGHGGVLDRIDSITAAVPIFVFGMLWLNGFVGMG